MSDDLDDMVRHGDPDRWLAAQAAGDADGRAALLALYGLNIELARVGKSVSNPLVGEIRLAWWRERLETITAGDADAHPVLKALQPAVTAGRLPLAKLLDLVEARHTDLDPEPFADEAALVAFIDGTAGTIMTAAAQALDPLSDPSAVIGASRAWGWAGLYRAGPVWADKGRRWRPASWLDASDDEVFSHVAHRVEAARQAANVELKSLPAAAFPAVAYGALARPYLRQGKLSAFGKQARLVAASLRGRI